MSRKRTEFSFDINDYDSEEEMLALYLKKVERQEKYLFFEKYRGKMCCYNDLIGYGDNSNNTIDDIIDKQNQLKALRTALIMLPQKQRSYIEEYFFSSCKVTITELAKHRNITKQTYRKNLQRYLSNLRCLVMEVYDEF